MADHLALPILMPLLGALSALLCFWQIQLVRWFVLLTLLATLTYSSWLLPEVAREEYLVSFLGNWPVPYGIALVADAASSLLMFVLTIVTIATFLALLTDEISSGPWSFVLLLVLLLMANGTLLTTDLLNLVVWLTGAEQAAVGLLLVTSRRLPLRPALTMLLLQLMGSVGLLVGTLIAATQAGTLNIAQLGVQFELLDRPGTVTIVAGVLLLAFLLKAAVYPFSLWWPGTLSAAKAPVAGLLAAVLPALSIYACYRVLNLAFQPDLDFLRPLLLTFATITLVVGVLGSLALAHIRAALALLLTSQTAYFLLGLALPDGSGLLGGWLLLLGMIFALVPLLYLSGALEQACQTPIVTYMNGVAAPLPLLGALWLFASLILLGLPPLPGFLGRLALLQAAVSQSSLIVAALVVGGSLLIILPVLRLWQQIFLQQPPEEQPVLQPITWRLYVPPALLLGLLVVGGLAADPLVEYVAQAARQTADLAGYVSAVLQE